MQQEKEKEDMAQHEQLGIRAGISTANRSIR